MERRTRSINNSHPALTRRDFLYLAGCATAGVAFGGCLPASPSQVIRRSIGVWSKENVVGLALDMMTDSTLNDLAYAGSLLLKNQNNEPSFSTVSPLFEDIPLVIETKSSIANDPIIGATPMVSTLRGSNEWAEIKVGQNVWHGSTSMRFEKIVIAAGNSEELSDFTMKFLIAKEVFNAKALEDMTSVLTGDIFRKYGEPRDLRYKNAIKLAYLESRIDGAPAPFVMDIWAHYYMVPNFNKAKDKGLFSSSELKGDTLRLFRMVTDQFTKEGLLKGKKEGYSWNSEAENFWDIWFKFAVAGYQAFTEFRS